MNVGKLIGAFALGAVAGAAASYIFFKERFQERANEEIKEMMEYTKEKISEVERKAEEDNKISEKLNDIKASADALTRPYNTFSAPKKDIRYVSTVMSVSPSEVDEVYPIDNDEFINGEVYYEKNSYKYFVGDKTLVDEMEEPVEIDHCVGYDMIALLEDSDSDTMYFRNPDSENDYEITKSNGSYKDLIGDI